MYRYELTCNDCGTIIGYMSLPHKSDDDNYTLNKVQCWDTIEPICCPVCEVRRLKENNNADSN